MALSERDIRRWVTGKYDPGWAFEQWPRLEADPAAKQKIRKLIDQTTDSTVRELRSEIYEIMTELYKGVYARITDCMPEDNSQAE